jgi:hypothetical protein
MKTKSDGAEASLTGNGRICSRAVHPENHREQSNTNCVLEQRGARGYPTIFISFIPFPSCIAHPRLDLMRNGPADRRGGVSLAPKISALSGK